MSELRDVNYFCFRFYKIAVRNYREVSNKRQETRLTNVTDKKKLNNSLLEQQIHLNFFEIESIKISKQLYLFQSLNQLMLNLTEA